MTEEVVRKLPITVLFYEHYRLGRIQASKVGHYAESGISVGLHGVDKETLHP